MARYLLHIVIMRTLLRHDNVWDIFDTFNDRLFNDIVYTTKRQSYYNETETGYEYELELPGYSKKDVKISAVDGVITINAVKGEGTLNELLDFVAK